MMMLQVENIDAAFDDIKKCRENGWKVKFLNNKFILQFVLILYLFKKKPQPPTPQAPKGTRLTKRPLTQMQNNKAKTTNSSVPVKKPSTAPSNTEAAKKREEQRKQILEMKRKQKAAMQSQNGSSENQIDEAVNGDSKKENGMEIFL